MDGLLAAREEVGWWVGTSGMALWGAESVGGLSVSLCKTPQLLFGSWAAFGGAGIKAARTSKAETGSLLGASRGAFMNCCRLVPKK